MNIATTMLVSTGQAEPLAERADVSFIRCRKCRTPVRCRAPILAELRGDVDREVRCSNPDCRTLLAMWSSSTAA